MLFYREAKVADSNEQTGKNAQSWLCSSNIKQDKIIKNVKVRVKRVQILTRRFEEDESGE